jgi:hypothetical protein
LNTPTTDAPVSLAEASQCICQMLSALGPKTTPASNSPSTAGSPRRDAREPAVFAATISMAINKSVWSEALIGLHEAGQAVADDISSFHFVFSCPAQGRMFSVPA